VIEGAQALLNQQVERVRDMASLKHIKGRIKSVNSTKQITNAMNLVATAKLTKSKEAALKTRPYFQKMQQTIASIVSNAGNVKAPLLQSNGAKGRAYVVLAGDKGLAGGYNANVCKMVANHIEDKESTQIIAVGRKAKEILRAKGFKISKEVLGVSADPTYSVAKEVADYVMELFLKGEVGEVYFVYTTFVSTLQQDPTLVRLLPAQVEKTETRTLLTYEPSAEVVLDYLMPKYLTDVIYGGLVESSASEQGARMTAMDAATENAQDMIEKLSIQYNRARQAVITQELTEIIGGAEALK
jgi:F-type H+-transporting ATPase subunit gamma